MSERGDGRPGSGMYAVFEIMVERLDALLGRLEGVGEELEAVNRRLGEMGREGIARRGVGSKRDVMGRTATSDVAARRLVSQDATERTHSGHRLSMYMHRYGRNTGERQQRPAEPDTGRTQGVRWPGGPFGIPSGVHAAAGTPIPMA